MRIKKLLYILPLLATTSCNSCSQIYGNNYHIVLDPKFNTLQVSVIHSAIDQWIMGLQDKGLNLDIEYMGQEECKRGDSEIGKICIYYNSTLFFIENGFEPANFNPANGGVTALTTRYDNDSSDIFVDMDYWTGNSPLVDFSHCIQHEMGHAFGLEHTRTGVMFWWYNPKSNSSYNVADVDVEQYLWWRHISNTTPDFYH